MESSRKKVDWSAIVALICLSACLLTLHNPVAAEEKNGFNLDNSSIPPDLILHGGPPRDGIPAIDHPQFLNANDAGFLHPDDRILGVVVEGVAKAYPIRILNWHEIVNDRSGSTPFAVTFCPLCGTGVVFLAKDEKGQRMSFGVSGLLFNSDVLLYDRTTESLWSQIMGKAISGPHKGTNLKKIPVAHTSWKAWKLRHPETLVLSGKTGISRDYDRDPYLGYEQSGNLFFPVTSKAPPDYHPKERIIGLEVEGVFKAYPFVELEKSGQNKIRDRVNGKNITVIWDSENSAAHVEDEQGRQIPTITAFWFAWYAFHPETDVYKSGF